MAVVTPDRCSGNAVKRSRWPTQKRGKLPGGWRVHEAGISGGWGRERRHWVPKHLGETRPTFNTGMSAAYLRQGSVWIGKRFTKLENLCHLYFG